MKRFMLAAIAAATFSTAACGGDPCKKVVEKVCAEAKDGCDAWKKTFEEGKKLLGDKAGDMCKVMLDNKAAMDSTIKAAKAMGGAAAPAKK